MNLLFNQNETAFMAKALADLAHVPKNTQKKIIKMRLNSNSNNCHLEAITVVHAVPKPRAKTSKNSWMKLFGINTSLLYKWVSVCVCACLRKRMPNVESNTNICNRE